MLNEIKEPVESDNREQKPKYSPGNEADFERLYQASYGKILGTLTAMLGDRAAAEDCAQDAFERAYRKWSTWKPIAPAEAWTASSLRAPTGNWKESRPANPVPGYKSEANPWSLVAAKM